MSAELQESPKVWTGSDDFEKLLHKSNVFVDKSMLLRELLDDGNDTLLITRPRRWGKSLNMDMMKRFFEIEVDMDGIQLPENIRKNRKLFVGGKITLPNGTTKNLRPLKISSDPIAMLECGNHPVISVGLKNVKSNNYEAIESTVRSIVLKAFYNHSSYLLAHVESGKIELSDDEKDKFLRYHTGKVDLEDIKDCFRFLTEILYKHFGRKTYIMIDEYDTPINSAYLELGNDSEEFEKVLKLFRGIFGSSFKTNNYLEKGVITGILRVAKANLFSDLNNLGEYCLLDTKFSKHYGFNEEEVDELFHKSGLDTKRDQIKKWYNGYAFGGHVVYNPWSIMRCIANDGKLQPYWVDSGGTQLVDKVLLSDEIQDDLQELIDGRGIIKRIYNQISLSDIDQNHEIFYSLMLFTGYLNPKAVGEEDEDFYEEPKYELTIPNREVRSIYIDRVRTWAIRKLNIQASAYDDLIDLFVNQEFELFTLKFKDYLMRSTSYHDLSRERDYHNLIGGIFAPLVRKYLVYSNLESGYGRFDHMLIPRIENKSDTAFILEYKTSKDHKNLSKVAATGLKQINNLGYDTKITSHDNVKKIIKICFAFSGKDMEMVWEIEEIKGV